MRTVSPPAAANGTSASTDHPEAKSLLPGLVLAGCGAVAFSGKAIIVKLAYRQDVDAITLIMYRMLFALPFFICIAWWASRGKAALSRRDWVGVVGLGFSGYYLSSFLDFLGLQFVSASLERLIMYLNPTLVMGLGWLLYRRPAHWLHMVGMLVSYCGVALVFGMELHAQGAGAAWGALLILMSAVLYSLYLVYSGELVRKLGALRLTGLASTVACLCCIVQFLLLKPMSAAQVPVDILWLSLLNATVCTVLPIGLVMAAIERIGASLAAQSGMVGPVSTIALGALVLGEPITGWVAVGTALVLAGIFVFTRAPRQAG
jgi:drug/metabolite transporter (DMT)-like permease